MVTGGARGIGRGIAERMVGRGYAVLVTDVDGEAARRTASEIGAVAGIEHDVRDPAAHRLVATTALDHGRLTAWFNNAGVGDDGRLVDLTDEQVQRLVEVNLLGCLWGMRAALAAFDRGGDLVNTASLSGLGPVPGYAGQLGETRRRRPCRVRVHHAHHPRPHRSRRGGTLGGGRGDLQPYERCPPGPQPGGTGSSEGPRPDREGEHHARHA